jgi:hypothetical protein
VADARSSLYVARIAARTFDLYWFYHASSYIWSVTRRFLLQHWSAWSIHATIPQILFGSTAFFVFVHRSFVCYSLLEVRKQLLAEVA